jgi:hypothetical protein
MSYCDDFDGGFCEIRGLHVMKRACKICNQRWPNKIELAKNFSKAVARRMPEIKNRTDDEQARIFAICEACERYEDGRCRHVKCGCYLKTKIKWETEHCPENKW